MYKKKKTKTTKVAPVKNHDKPQIDLTQIFENDKKIKPETIFEGYNKNNNKKKKK